MKTRLLFFILWVVLMSPSSVFAEKIYRHSMDSAPRSLAPLKAGDIYSNEIITAVYDTLYEYKYLKYPWEIKPNLAKSMPKISPDGLTYTIEIKKGVYFINDPCFPKGKGREVTAKDVIYSLKRHFHKREVSYGSWLWKNRIVGLDEWGRQSSNYNKVVEGLKAISKYTLQIKLVDPYPQMIYTLAMGYSAVVPWEAVKKYGKKLGYHSVGSGPFRLKTFNSGRCVLLRNPNYRKELMDLEGFNHEIHGFTGVRSLAGKTLPIVDRVEIRFFNSQNQRWKQLNGEGGVQYGLLPNEKISEVLKSVSPLSLNPEYEKRFIYQPNLNFGYVFNDFNMADPEIGYNEDPKRNEMNKALRLSIRKAFNWKERIDKFYMGIGKPNPGVLMPGLEGYSPSIDREAVTYDPDGAKKILKDNGWNAENLPHLYYHSVANTENIGLFEQLREWLVDIGYPTEKIKYTSYASFGDFFKAVHEKKCMFYKMSWVLDYPDPQNIFQNYYGPHKAPGPNGSNFQDKAYDRLYEQSMSMQPGYDRAQVYKAMNRILIDEIPCIAGFSRIKIHLWKKNVVMFYRELPLANVYKYVDIRP